MSNEYSVIPFEGKFGKLRAVVIDNEPWFVGKDVAVALGYKEPTKAVREKVAPEDRGMSKIDTPSAMQDMVIINESGIYSLILSSKLPTAKQFKQWVTSEVLPSIRKHGVYMTSSKIEEILTDPDNIIKIAQQLKAERAAKEAALKQIEMDKPKVEYAEALLTSSSCSTRTDFAKIAQQSGATTFHLKGITIWLQQEGYLTHDNKPTQRSIDLGIMVMRSSPYDTDHHGIQISRYAVITTKGEQYLLQKLREYHEKYAPITSNKKHKEQDSEYSQCTFTTN